MAMSRTLLFIVYIMSDVMSLFVQRSNTIVGLGAIISQDTILIGDIRMGPGNIIQPGAHIIAEAGPIIIGSGNIIQDMATIINRVSSDQAFKPVQIIGDGNVFEVGSTCEALRIGNGNVLKRNAFVSKEVELTWGCVIETGCYLKGYLTLPPGTVISGGQCRRWEMNDKPYPQIG